VNDLRHELEIERYAEVFGPIYSVWLNSQPRTHGTPWCAPMNEVEAEYSAPLEFKKAA
jgi:hypothetical protein